MEFGDENNKSLLIDMESYSQWKHNAYGLRDKMINHALFFKLKEIVRGAGFFFVLFLFVDGDTQSSALSRYQFYIRY